jgi:hypothetical protein
MARLQKDQGYQERVAERDRKLEQANAGLEEDERPLVAALKDAGVNVASVWDLVNTSDPYPKAFPVLLDHLGRSHMKKTREGIVRALSVEAARGVASAVLLEAFEQEQDADVRWVIGNALSVVATEAETAAVDRLLKDASLGEARNMLTHAVARLRGTDAIRDLVALLDDRGVAAQAIIALGDLKAVEARDRVAAFLNDDDEWVREQAQKALDKIDTWMS